MIIGFKKIIELLQGTALNDGYEIPVSEGAADGDTKKYSIAQLKAFVWTYVQTQITGITKGDTGATGAQGATGPQGATGLQGIKGDKGDQGLKGNNGAQGVAGIQGPKGDTGLTGATGPQGIQGVQGAQGIQGEAGVDGEVIVAGEATNILSGIVDPTTEGIEGDFYINTASRILFGPKTSGVWPNVGIILTGPTGPQGIQGIQGVPGAAGEAGANGENGATGPQGIQGEMGLTGPAGPQGVQGVQGVAGADGATGPQGLPGADGPQGPAGPTGADGPQGPAGADGVDGATGPAGADGATGPQGPSGPAGADGATGPAGSSDLPSGGTAVQYFRGDKTLGDFPFEIGLACSDETSDLASGTSKVTFRIPVAFSLTQIYASLATVATGSTIVVNIKKNGTTIFSTKISIDASEKTSVTATTPYVLTTTPTTFAIDDEITIDIDQVGAVTAGKGLKVFINGTRI